MREGDVFTLCWYMFIFLKTRGRINFSKYWYLCNETCFTCKMLKWNIFVLLAEFMKLLFSNKYYRGRGKFVLEHHSLKKLKRIYKYSWNNTAQTPLEFLYDLYRYIMWNHFCLWGSLFVNCQNVASSWKKLEIRN